MNMLHTTEMLTSCNGMSCEQLYDLFFSPALPGELRDIVGQLLEF